MFARIIFSPASGSNENFLSGSDSEISGDTAAFLSFFGSLDPFFVLCAFSDSVVPFFPFPELFASFF
jgi:hypothetical protein